MHRPLTHVLFACLTITIAPSALAADAVTTAATTGTNIFSTPDSKDTVPQFTEARSDRAANARKLLLGNKKDDIPNLRQVLNLPSLSPQQKRSLRESLKAHKTESVELTNKLKAMKERRDTAGSGAMTNPQDAQEFNSLRRQIQALRRQAWEDLKRQLTAQQIKDLDAMRKGELQPATFRTANDGAMMGQ
jgi:hypothetical protein